MEALNFHFWSSEREYENENLGEKVSFGSRRYGDAGRDIMIVKHALGVILPYASLVEEGDDDPSLEDPNGWFDCTTGKKISNREAASFDDKLQTYLMKFQLDNQFYILSYLFTKFMERV